MKKIITLLAITLTIPLTSCSMYDSFPPDDSFIIKPTTYRPAYLNPTEAQNAALR